MKRKWTDEETSSLLRMRKEGVSFERIGARLGRSSHACVQQHSKVRRPIVRLRENMTDLSRNGKKWSVAEDRLLKRMIKDERNMEDMVQELKRSEKAIGARMWMHTQGKKRRKVTPAKVDTVSEIDAELLVNFIRGLQEENKQLRAKLESIRSALK